MRIKYCVGILLLAAVCGCGASSKISRSETQLNSPNAKRILVAAHRGDWRNEPENSLPALKNAIAMGVDIAEFDLKRSKDGILVIMHDKTLDRTTDGKGKMEDYTLGELKKLRLRNGLGRPTENHIPTFSEYLDAGRGAILLDVDKGYDYFPEVVKMLRDKNMLDQAIINVDDNSTLDQVEAKHGPVPDDVWLMPIVDYKDSAKARVMTDSYRRHRKTIFQPVWNDDQAISTADFIALRKDGYGVWLNSLWPSLNGGHDDDKAVELGQTSETWGWLLDRGATVIQTDRPVQLLNYLKKKGLR